MKIRPWQHGNRRKRLAPFVVLGGMEAFPPAEVGNTCLSRRPSKHDADLLLRCELAAGLAFDLPDDGFRGGLPVLFRVVIQFS